MCIQEKLKICKFPTKVSVKMCAKFLCKFFKTKMCIQEKLKMCKFPIKASVQKVVQNFLYMQKYAICLLLL